MREKLLGWVKAFTVLFLTGTSLSVAAPVWILTINDTINPGTADYFSQGIEGAEKENAPFVLVQLDTPGGLLSSTRLMAQKMLNAKIPVVLFVSPRGAHAGSAGALLMFGADVAAMAPGTQLGAAHPVPSTGTKLDKVMEEKVTNDTAAFAESLARNRGRNAKWAGEAVKNSASLSAEDALRLQVIDLIGEDVPDLLKKLDQFTLRAPKQRVTHLPKGPWETKIFLPLIKQRLISFFSNPELAYLILVLGGLCVWIELAHPGLILPGVVGAFCIGLSLISFQWIPIHYGALFLIFLGMGLLIAELFVPAFGALGLGGIAAFIIGSLFLIDTPTGDFHIPLSLILPATGSLALSALLLSFLVFRVRRLPARSGMEGLIGQIGEVREAVSQTEGKVFVAGELWNAVADSPSPIPGTTRVVVIESRNMVLIVRPLKSQGEANEGAF